MYELFTIIAISYEGIKLSYTFIKILNTVYSYVEIVDKITDLNSYMKINKNTNNYMGKLYKLACFGVHQMVVADAKRQEMKLQKRMIMLEDERRKERALEDDRKEKEQFARGWLRDKRSKFYISPQLMLDDIKAGVLKNMTNEKWTSSDKEQIKKLFTSDTVTLTDFDKYEELFYYVQVLDHITRREFECKLLESEVYEQKNIMWLKEKQKRMVYENLAVINMEYKCVL
jgi:hypothetical protein